MTAGQKVRVEQCPFSRCVRPRGHLTGSNMKSSTSVSASFPTIIIIYDTIDGRTWILSQLTPHSQRMAQSKLATDSMDSILEESESSTRWMNQTRRESTNSLLRTRSTYTFRRQTYRPGDLSAAAGVALLRVFSENIPPDPNGSTTATENRCIRRSAAGNRRHSNRKQYPPWIGKRRWYVRCNWLETFAGDRLLDLRWTRAVTAIIDKWGFL